MRSRWNLPIYLVYLVGCLTVLVYIVAQLPFTAPWSHPYRLTATFSDADGILANNEVFMNGTKVGHVGQVSVVNGHAQVQLVLDNGNGLPIHPDATAQVRKKNLLGETYIDLSRGGDPGQIRTGGSIPLDHTVPITEIDQVLAVFDPETVQRVQLLINTLGEGTTNNGSSMNSQAGTLNDLITVLNGPTTELSVRHQQVHDIVLELQKFYDTLARQRDQVRQEFGTWNAVMQQLAAQDNAIGGTIQQADTLLQNIDTLVSTESGNIRSTLTGLPGTLKQLNAFLDQSNSILTNIAPYRRAIHDVFPDLSTAFADTDASGQHFWSVYSVNCNQSCTTTGSQTIPNNAAPNSNWEAVMGGW